jgi:small basic protein
MWFIAVLAGVLGFGLAYFSHVTIPQGDGVYVSVAALAGLDAVIGGFRAAQENKFQTKVFVTGFVVGSVIAVILTWFGERIGVEIGLAAVFVFVWRIMQNLSIIRSRWLAEDWFHIPHFPARTPRKTTVAPTEIIQS